MAADQSARAARAPRLAMSRNWLASPACSPVVFSVDRPVLIDMTRAFPGLGSGTRRQDELPLWVRAFGVRLEPWMPAADAPRWSCRCTGRRHCECAATLLCLYGLGAFSV